MQVGPYAVIEGPVTVGPGCIIHARAHLIGNLTLGARNVVHGGAVLGDWPQDRKYHGESSAVVIGDENVFREGSTVHRGTGAGTKTVMGNRCYLMVQAHVGHNCIVGNDVMMVNNAALGGFVHVGDRAIIGANSAVHQFTRVGRLAMLSNGAGAAVDVPPFFISMSTNLVVQLNLVGLRRAGVPRANIDALRQMLQFAFRGRRPLAAALADLPADVRAVPEVSEIIEFVRTSKRGVARWQAWSQRLLSDPGDEET